MIQAYFSTLLQCFFTLLIWRNARLLARFFFSWQSSKVHVNNFSWFPQILVIVSLISLPTENAQFSRAEAGTSIERSLEHSKGTFSPFLNDFLSNGPTNRLSIKTPESFSPKLFSLRFEALSSILTSGKTVFRLSKALVTEHSGPEIKLYFSFQYTNLTVLTILSYRELFFGIPSKFFSEAFTQLLSG